MATVSEERMREIIIIRFDNPPLNVLTADLLEKISRSLKSYRDDSRTSALVLTGRKNAFAAGADIKRLAQGTDRDIDFGLRPLTSLIEGFPKPIVCALAGLALGGGLEIALSCHYRIAQSDATFGQPEVKIGLIPGGGGTQRLPRLVGTLPAAELCATGKTLTAAEAWRWGLLDRTVDEHLVMEAVQLARALGLSKRPSRLTGLQPVLPDQSTARRLEDLRKNVRKKYPRQPARLLAIDAVELAADVPLEEGLKRESDLFDMCLQSREAQNLIHLFLSERTAATGTKTLPPSKPIARAAILGAGTMGTGIAIACLNAGIAVRLNDDNSEALKRSRAKIEEYFLARKTSGKLSSLETETRLGSFSSAPDESVFEDADIVIETITENLACKRRVLKVAESHLPPNLVLATNTSTLDIDRLAANLRHPERLVGLHFFNPAPVMKLVELSQSERNSPEALAVCATLAKQLGKLSVIVAQSPGYIGNRMFAPYLREAQFLVEEGASVSQVDQIMVEFGWRLGPLATLDLIGNDTAGNIRQTDRPAAAARKPFVPQLLSEEKRWGQKSGLGWYRYPTGTSRPEPDTDFENRIRETALELKIPQQTFATGEIINRLLLPMINEAARILKAGIARQPSDIDIVMVHGFGFPAYWGGPLRYADQRGAKNLLESLLNLEKRYSARFRPAPLLRKLTRGDRSFASL